MGKKEDEIINAKVRALEATKDVMLHCGTDAAAAVAAMAKYTSEKAGDDVMLNKSQAPKFTGKAPAVAGCPVQ